MAKKLLSESAVISAKAAELLRLDNDMYRFSGYVNSETPTPTHSRDKVYVAESDGVIFGISGVLAGQLIWDDGADFIVKYLDNRTPQNVSLDFLGEDETQPLVVSHWGGATVTTETNNLFGTNTEITKIVCHADGNVFFLNNNPISNYSAGDNYNFALLIYSNDVCEITLRGYASAAGYVDEWLDQRKLKLNKGVNFVQISAVLASVQPYFQLIFSGSLSGKVFYVKSAIGYFGQKRMLPVVDPFIAAKAYTDEYAVKRETNKIVDVYTKLLLKNLCTTNLTTNYAAGNCSVVAGDVDNSVRVYKTMASGAGATWLYFFYYMGENWTANHKYLVTFDMEVVRNDYENNYSMPQSAKPKYGTGVSLGIGDVKQRVDVGSRGLVKMEVTINETISYDSKSLFIQAGKYAGGEGFDITIFNVLVSDLGEIDSDSEIEYSVVDTIVDKHGIIDGYAAPEMAESVGRALSAAESDKTKAIDLTANAIECWGDSLTAANYAQYLAALTGRTVTAHGYSGEKSYYIRDMFLAGVDKTKVQIIWVGRNNYSEPDYVVDDVRKMVEYLEHSNFIIMSVLNGGYGLFADYGGATGEMLGGDNYHYFTEIADRLKAAYPDNFLDVREFLIENYDFGGVTLDASFVQPDVNSNVQIQVSDADFLTTFNTSDIVNYPDIDDYIRIGINGVYDVYQLVSKDSSIQVTLKLISSGLFAPGETVANPVDGTNTKYLRVMQELDYQMYINNTTPSSLRVDSIHQTEIGKQYTAKAIAWKLNAMKI